MYGNNDMWKANNEIQWKYMVKENDNNVIENWKWNY